MNEPQLSKDELLKNGLYLMELLRSALRGQPPSPKPEDVSWAHVFALAKRHRVEGLSAYGMERLSAMPPESIRSRWLAERELIVYRSVRYALERENLLQALKEAGLRCLPLKGILLAEYYPQAGMRAMTDNDILYAGQDGVSEQEAYEILARVMTQCGFQLHGSNGVHNVYVKSPFFNFEMHRQLFSESSPLGSHIRDPWAYASEDETGVYRFSPEVEFIYIMAHAYKHFSNAGHGIRLLADVHVFLKHAGDALDMAYIFKAFRTLGMEDFAQRVITCAREVFDSPDMALSDDSLALLEYLLSSGLFGTYTHMIENRARKRGVIGEINLRREGLRFLFERVFPSKSFWHTRYPITRGRPWLYPLCWIHRLIKKLTTGRKHTFHALRSIFKTRQ